MNTVCGVLVLTLYQTISGFSQPIRRSLFENIVGNEVNAGNQHFPQFPQRFPLSPARRHCKHTYLSSLGILGKKQNYFHMR